MRRAVWTSFAGMLLSLSLSACAGHSHAQRASSGGAAPAISASGLPVAERQAVELDLAALPESEVLEFALGESAPPQYRALTEIECQCLAARGSTLGNLLSQERRAARTRAVRTGHHLCRPASERVASLQRRLLAEAALEARNESAGTALVLYYRLAEAEAQRDISDQSLQVLEQAQREIDQLQERGLELPPAAADVANQARQARGQRAEAGLAVAKLNSELRERLRFADGESFRFWPAVQWQVLSEPQDIDAAIAEGLMLRPELRLLRTLDRQLDEDTLPAARGALGAINGMLGIAPAAARCPVLARLKQVLCCVDADAQELAARRRQIRTQLAAQEQAVAEEIRRADHEVNARAIQVALANETWQATTDQKRDAQSRQTAAKATLFDVMAAELASLQRRGELLSQAVAWQIARVHFRQAQGLLIQECR